MAKLHPTLWRTCRILAGETRLELLRRVIESPDQTVTDLASQMKISIPRASQELRRLQSRGLIQASRRDMNVLYRPIPDPLVTTAEPLLHAMRETFRRAPTQPNEQTIRIAVGFSHVRRLVIVRLLLLAPMDTQALETMAGMSRDALNRHLLKLKAGELVKREGRRIHLERPDHPLAHCLLDMLQDSPVVSDK